MRLPLLGLHWPRVVVTWRTHLHDWKAERYHPDFNWDAPPVYRGRFCCTRCGTTYTDPAFRPVVLVEPQ